MAGCAVGALAAFVVAMGAVGVADAQTLAGNVQNPDKIALPPKPAGQRFRLETIKTLFPGATLAGCSTAGEISADGVAQGTVADEDCIGTAYLAARDLRLLVTQQVTQTRIGMDIAQDVILAGQEGCRSADHQRRGAQENEEVAPAHQN